MVWLPRKRWWIACVPRLPLRAAACCCCRGDINTGVPESDLQDAEPDFRGMNLVGYDAMAIGNHEFDNPLNVLRQQQKWADFPLLSANIYAQDSGKRLFQPYQMFDRQDPHCGDRPDHRRYGQDR